MNEAQTLFDSLSLKILDEEMKYLFWNVHKNEKINSVLCNLIVENGISVVVLAEYSANINDLIELLGSCGVSMKQIHTVGCDRIHMLGKVGLRVEPQLQTDRSSVQVIDDNIILCGVHLNSQIYSDNAERREIDIEQIVANLLSLETELGTKNTIIVGDFNINPYDKTCISARFFHGIPIFEDAMRETRTVAGKEFHMFYNPMWNFLGDFTKPYGTYYRRSSDTVNPYWNVYDQVIIRPALRKRFVDDSLKIITETASISLLDKNNHPDCNISDHLPITFEIKEEDHG